MFSSYDMSGTLPIPCQVLWKIKRNIICSSCTHGSGNSRSESGLPANAQFAGPLERRSEEQQNTWISPKCWISNVKESSRHGFPWGAVSCQVLRFHLAKGPGYLPAGIWYLTLVCFYSEVVMKDCEEYSQRNIWCGRLVSLNKLQWLRSEYVWQSLK